MGVGSGPPPGLLLGDAHLLKNVPSRPQRAVEDLKNDLARACLVKLEEVLARPGAGYDVEVRPAPACVLHDVEDALGGVDRDHQRFRMLKPRALQQLRAPWIAQVGFEAAAAGHIDRLDVGIEHDGLESVDADQAVHRVSEPADARDDDGAELADLLVGQPVGRIPDPLRQILVSDEQRRGQDHRHGRDEYQGRRAVRGDPAGLLHEIEKYECELAGLRQPQREQPLVAAPEPEQPRKEQQHRRLDQYQQQGHAQDREEFSVQQAEVDVRTDHDEEQAEQQPLERGDVRLHLVPELGVRQHDAREKGSKGGRKADEAHDEGRHHDQEQGGGRRDLQQPGIGDVAEQRTDQEMPAKNDERDRGGHDSGDDQRRQAVQERLRDFDAFAARGSAGAVRVIRDGAFACDAASGQQRDDDQHRNDGDILRKKDGEARPPAIGLGKPLLGKRLQHDGRGRKRQCHPDADGHGEGHAEQRGRPRQQDGRDRDLEAAKPDQPVPHFPERLRLELKTYHEHEHDDPELGESVESAGIEVQQPADLADDDAGDQVAENGSETDSLRERHGHHGGGQENCREEQERRHLSARKTAGARTAHSRPEWMAFRRCRDSWRSAVTRHGDHRAALTDNQAAGFGIAVVHCRRQQGGPPRQPA